MDGRPTPMGVCFHHISIAGSVILSNDGVNKILHRFLQVRMKSRVESQRELAKKIIQGIREVDSAKAGHQQRLQAKEAERQGILDSKLKPKGKLLAKKPAI